jgi:hypothetical protein
VDEVRHIENLPRLSDAGNDQGTNYDPEADPMEDETDPTLDPLEGIDQ